VWREKRQLSVRNNEKVERGTETVRGRKRLSPDGAFLNTKFRKVFRGDGHPTAGRSWLRSLVRRIPDTLSQSALSNESFRAEKAAEKARRENVKHTVA
jgi:hypothetical protein